jgi:DNA-binding XRE family transcriptional regulator
MTLDEMPDYTLIVPPKEYEKVIMELIAWCAAERGRQQELATELDVSRKTVNSWVKLTRRPSLEQYFKLRAFLKKQQRRKKPEAD